MRWHWAARALRFVVFAVLAVILLTVVVMSLWNVVLPAIFGWPLITFWQAMGLLVLTRVLFGRLGGGGGRRMHWRRRMMERYSQMTPEERARFEQGLRGHCRRWRPTETTPTPTA